MKSSQSAAERTIVLVVITTLLLAGAPLNGVASSERTVDHRHVGGEHQPGVEEAGDRHQEQDEVASVGDGLVALISV
jgi:hypothetical protein